LLVAALVVINTVIMAVEMQYLGLKSGYALDFTGVGDNVEDTWSGAPRVFLILERVFTTVFAAEMSVRIAILRSRFFRNWLCTFDILAVSVGLADWAVSGESFLVNTAVIRLLRLAKLARGLRLLKMPKILESLHLLTHSISASISTLLWTLVVLTIVQCIMGMFFGQICQSYLADSSNGDQSRRKVYEYFGTFTRTMVSMYEILLANWAPPCRVLMEEVGEWIAGFLVVYRCVAGFAVLNVVSAVFIQQTMDLARNHEEIKVMQKSKAQEQTRHMLSRLFKGLDTSGDGRLSREELGQLLTNKQLVNLLSVLDMEPQHVGVLFDMFDTGSGDISSEEFVLGASRVKGPATSIDMARVLCAVFRIEQCLAELQQRSAMVDHAFLRGRSQEDPVDCWTL